MSSLGIILRLKGRIVVTSIRSIRRHIVIHLSVFALLLLGILIGGFGFFRMTFDFFLRMEVLGPPLMDLIVGMVLMTFFFMLIFSNLIVTLSTAYLSNEVEFFMSLPARRRSIFAVRLTESFLFSSWAFGVLSLPLVLAYGGARDAPASFYFLTAALAFPFLLIPAGIGALMTMTLAALFPARRTFRMAILLAALGAAMALLMARQSGLRAAMKSAELDNFRQMMSALNLGGSPMAPSAWLLKGMSAAAGGQWKESLYWMAMLASTALLLLQICHWMAGSVYYRGWGLASESSTPRRSMDSRPRSRWLHRALSPLRPPLRALVIKDIQTFWRDPSQWPQLMILFGLLFIYVASLRAYAHYSARLGFDDEFWRAMLSLFNLGAACFVLSILTTRFVYPMLSLEGRQFWTIGLAPITRESLVWEKYWLCWTSALLLTSSLMIFSSLVLRVDVALTALSLATVAMMSFALTSISVGLGAMTPNFKEDNPARIANGMGATMSVFLSLSYIGIVILIEIYPVFLYATGQWASLRHPQLLIATCATAFLTVNAAAIVIPMRLGIRRWREMEF